MADHVIQYLELKGETLYKVNDQRGERAHQIVAKLERVGGFKNTKNLTGARKLKKSHSFHCHFNLHAKHRRLHKLKYFKKSRARE